MYRPRKALALGPVLALAAALALLSQALPPAAPPARPASGPAYLFLSPNTDEALSPAEAARRLRSPAQARYRELAEDILRQVGASRWRLIDAVGDWSDGVENSLLAEVPEPPELATLRYAAVWFGLLARQRAVLAFGPGAGPDAVTRLDLPEQDLSALRRALDRHGVRFRTIVPTRQGHRLIVFDEGRRLAGPLAELGREYGTRPRVTAGTGAEVSEATRGGARERYRAVIRAYEAGPSRALYRPAHPAQIALGR